MAIGARVAVPCGKKAEKRRGRVFPSLREALHTRTLTCPKRAPQRPNFRRVLAGRIGRYSPAGQEKPLKTKVLPFTASPAKRGLDLGRRKVMPDEPSAAGGFGNFLGK